QAPSWLLALRDPALARVLAALHDRPAERWTVASLAREVHISRATLARRFAEAVGEPPLTYLARWRMHLAAQRLKYSTDTVEAIAREVRTTMHDLVTGAHAQDRGESRFSLSRSATRSIVTIRPRALVNPTTAIGFPAGATTKPALPFTIAGRANRAKGRPRERT